MQTVEKIYETALENPLKELGLWDSPSRRMIAIGAFTGIALKIARPQALFDSAGQPRPSYFTATREQGGVPLSWWMVSGLAGILSVILV